jgi:hypothetical protein
MEWIEVEKELPKTNKPVLTWQFNEFHPECEISVKFHTGDKWIDVTDMDEVEPSGEYPYITHWIPLPEPPKPSPPNEASR